MHESHEHGRRWILIFLFFCVFILGILCTILFQQIMNTPRAQILDQYRHSHFPGFSRGQMATTTDVSLIRAWMTFDYVNETFALPADYLRTALPVSDARYPNLSLEEYAKEAATTSAQITSDVTEAVSAYLTAEAKP